MTTIQLTLAGLGVTCASACAGFAAGYVNRGERERKRWRDSAMALKGQADAAVAAADDEPAFGILVVTIALRMFRMGTADPADVRPDNVFAGLAGEFGDSLRRALRKAARMRASDCPSTHKEIYGVHISGRYNVNDAGRAERRTDNGQ